MEDPNEHSRPKVGECCRKGALCCNVALGSSKGLNVRRVDVVIILMMQLDTSMLEGPDMAIPSQHKQTARCTVERSRTDLFFAPFSTPAVMLKGNTGWADD